MQLGHSLIKNGHPPEDITILNIYAPNKSYKICEPNTDRNERKNGLILQLQSESSMSLLTTERTRRQKLAGIQ